MNNTAARISKLDLHTGDTLVIMVPQRLDAKGHALYKEFMEAHLPAGITCMVLDGGVTLDKLKREHEAEVDSAAYRAAFGLKDGKAGKVGWWQRVSGWVNGREPG